MDWYELLDVASKSLPLILLAGGLIGFVFRTSISAWINTRFTKAVNKELATQTHQLNLDLEGYKAALMRDLEQLKANIDIKRSIALKMADARLEALRSLAYELNRFNNECGSFPIFSAQQRHNLNLLTEFNESVAAVRRAQRTAVLFLPLDFNHEIAAYTAFAMGLAHEYNFDNEATLQHDDPRIQELNTRYAKVSSKLRMQIYADPEQLN